MRKFTFLLTIVVFTLFVGFSSAITVEHPLDEPFQYYRIIGPLEITQHSPVDIYVANVFDPMRWKEWYIEIWIPETEPDIASIIVDYDNTPDHSDPLEQYAVDLTVITGEPLEQGFKGFYAEGGTTIQGSGGLHDWGNPAWVSFHIPDVAECSPLWYYIEDCCIPEPATIALVGFGALALLRKKQ